MIPDGLSDIHPAVIHFPIALLLFGWLVDGAARLFPRISWLHPSALLLYVTGTAGLVAAYFSGKAAAGALMLEGVAREAVAAHAELGEWTLWFFLLATVLRLALRDVRTGRLAVLLWLLFLPGSYLLVDTAMHGGELVYRHGVHLQRARVETVTDSLFLALPPSPEAPCDTLPAPPQVVEEAAVGCEE